VRPERREDNLIQLRTRRGAMAQIGSVLTAATLLVGVSACSSDDEPTDDVNNEIQDELD
jgi:hypothetical protein